MIPEIESQCLARLSKLSAKQRNIVCALCCTKAFAWYRTLPHHLQSPFAQSWSQVVSDLWRAIFEGEQSTALSELNNILEQMQAKVDGIGVSETEFDSFDEDPIDCTYQAVRACCLNDLESAEFSVDRLFRMAYFMLNTLEEWMKDSRVTVQVRDADVLSIYIALPIAMDKIEAEELTKQQLTTLKSEFS